MPELQHQSVAPANTHRSIRIAIMSRAAIYGTACSLYFMITLVCSQWLKEPERGFVESLLQSAEDASYWMPGFLLLVPIAAHDLMKMSEHIAHPIQRLHDEMYLLVDGRSERPVVVNENEYFCELTSAYNQVRGELLQLRKQIAELQAEPEESLPPSLMSADDESENEDSNGSTDAESLSSEDSNNEQIAVDEAQTDEDDDEDMVKRETTPIMPVAIMPVAIVGDLIVSTPTVVS